jgi:thiol peroxidase
MKGKPLTLAGRALKLNAPAAHFHVLSQSQVEVGLSDFSNKIKVITFFPSLDTPVCDIQVRNFNKRATDLSQDIVVLGISKDLPFAQKRFCLENNIKRVEVLSDYRSSSFGLNYGVLIKELNLLARGALIVDKDNYLRFIHIVDELSSPPDYNAVFEALEKITHNPLVVKADQPAQHCLPCEGGVAALPAQTVQQLIAQHRNWELVEARKLVKEFHFNDFADAKYFLDLVAMVAQEEGHHPTMTLSYQKVRITLTTHAAGGLTDNDFIMARIIDELIE